jgi:hydroxyethylthiazole kinase
MVMSDSNANLGTAALAFDARVRKSSPLIHHITNYVVMNLTANVTLALGAQPVMAHAPQEVEEMEGFASALVLNIGTLDDAWVESMVRAGKEATRRGTPIVLDPVGAGATKLRTGAARRLLDELDVTVLRGNAGEVLAVAGEAGQVRGVDSVAKTEDAVQVARAIAKDRKIIVAITGPVDVVTDGERVYSVANGHAMMGRVTGTGCSATAAIACFLGAATAAERCLATASALAVFGRAGEMAMEASRGPGTFVPAFLDALFAVQEAIKPKNLRINEAL